MRLFFQAGGAVRKAFREWRPWSAADGRSPGAVRRNSGSKVRERYAQKYNRLRALSRKAVLILRWLAALRLRFSRGSGGQN